MEAPIARKVPMEALALLLPLLLLRNTTQQNLLIAPPSRGGKPAISFLDMSPHLFNGPSAGPSGGPSVLGPLGPRGPRGSTILRASRL